MTLDHPGPALAEVNIPDELLGKVAERAQGIDAGEVAAREAFPALAEAGLVDLGAPSNNGSDLVKQAAVLHALAERSLSTAFALWGHRMSIEYLTLSGGPFAETLLPQLRAGTTPGVSGMAPGFKTFAGAGDLSLTVERDTQGQLRLSGSLPWASNLYSDAIAVAAAYGPAKHHDSNGAHQKLVVAFPLDAEGVTVGRDLNLMALQGTASTFVELDNVALSEHHILTDDFNTFMSHCRPTFSILQSSFCLGLATASYQHARTNVAGINEVFEPDVQRLGDKLAAAQDRLSDYALKVATQSAPQPKDLLSMRLEAGTLAVELATAELRSAGGKSYITTSDTNRRYREAAFLPVQSPSEAQLRWELARA